MYISEVKSNHFSLTDVFKISTTLEFKRKFDESLHIVEKFLTICKNPAVSFGGGKDGTAVLILAQHIFPNIKIICADPPNPIDGRNLHINNVINNGSGKIIRCNYFWNVYDVLNGKEKYPEGLKMKALKEKQAELKIDGIIWGCRNSESRSRQINFARNGYIYQVKDGTWRCQPIAKWTAEESLALAFASGYPINPVYEKMDGIYNLDNLHDGTWWPHGVDDTKGYWLKKYYPQHYENYLSAQKVYQAQEFISCSW